MLKKENRILKENDIRFTNCELRITTYVSFIYSLAIVTAQLLYSIVAIFNPKARLFVDGRKGLFEKLKSTMASKGLTAMEAKGKPFDSDLHEAIANVPAPAKNMVGKVVDDVEKGYLLNDKVIRYAKVVVGQ